MSAWTIQKLQQHVEEALHIEPANANGRVTPVPNARTIRYYTTAGLVDKPTIQSGQAHYKKRHLLQVLAIKRLQADGVSLDDIRSQIAGLADLKLRKIAKLPREKRLKRARGELLKQRLKFWSAPAAEADLKPKPLPFTVLRGLELQDGTILTFKTRRGLWPADVEAINAAAAPLLETLNQLGLLQP